MVTSLVESFPASNGNVRQASIIGASRPDQSRIIATGINKDISSRDDVQSTVHNDVGKANKLDTTVERSSTDEWNTASSRIEEGTPESIFRKVVKQLDSSKQMNLAKSLSVHTLELVYFRHPAIQTDNVGDRRSGGVATRISNKDGIWKPTLSDIETAATHGEIETISEKLAYRKFIKDSDFETIKVFEQENIKRKNIKYTETGLRMTRIDEQKMKNIEERENIKDIETQLKITRSEHSSISNCKKHGPKVNSEPDPSSSDSSDLSSSDSEHNKEKKKKKKKRRKHQKDDS